MECTYCKEEIKQGAIKCKNCGEFLKFKVQPAQLLRTLVQVVIPVLSLSLACFEFARANSESRSREKAELAAATAEDQAEQTVAILERMPKDVVLDRARAEVGPQAFSEIEKGDFVRAEKEFQMRLKENPKDDAAKRGLIYSGVLKKIEQRERPN